MIVFLVFKNHKCAQTTSTITVSSALPVSWCHTLSAPCNSPQRLNSADIISPNILFSFVLCRESDVTQYITNTQALKVYRRTVSWHIKIVFWEIAEYIVKNIKYKINVKYMYNFNKGAVSWNITFIHIVSNISKV